MFSALRKSLRSEFTFSVLQSNVLAGLTVGVISLPLAMALAIAIGAPPQNGLYTSIIAGVIIAITGGSKVNISGPTAAFVVILIPIIQQYGLGGLLISGFLSGVILILMGLFRLGDLIKVVPYPVTIGFTAGIGVVIATLQVKDFLGLNIISLDGHFTEKVAIIIRSLPSISWRETAVGLLTFAILILWKKLRTRIPSHIVAILFVSVVVWLASLFISDFQVETIGSRFEYVINGIQGHGIPSLLPSFAWPWQMPGPDGSPIGISYELVRKLFIPAITIAVLGSLESLLCAVVADGMTGRRHNPNDELIGQGIGNMIVPLFGGIPATAAMARTAANIRAGGSLPISSIVHALFILLSIVIFAPLLAFIPMASMAALLLMVAWDMSETKHFIRIVRCAPRNDMFVLLTCFILTVTLDMEIAVAVGMVLAALLFIHRSIELTGIKLIEHKESERIHFLGLPNSILIYDIDGAMFFGSAQKALSSLTNISKDIKVVILDMTDVTMLDMTAMVAIESITENCKNKSVKLIINNLDKRMIDKLANVGVQREEGLLDFSKTIDEAMAISFW